VWNRRAVPHAGATSRGVDDDAGIRMVVLPNENEKDLNEIPANVRRKLRFVLVEHMDQVLSEGDEVAFLPPVSGG